jgi:hypothetical protein
MKGLPRGGSPFVWKEGQKNGFFQEKHLTRAERPVILIELKTK